MPIEIRYTFFTINIKSEKLKVKNKMKYRHLLIFVTMLASLITLPAQAEEGVWADVKRDYNEFYSADRFIRMGLMFTGGALMANTSFDQEFQDRNKGNIFSVDDSYNFKQLGEGKYLIPLSLISAGIGHWLSDNGEPGAIGTWGERTARAYLVGGPTVLVTQLLTGASRPSEDKMISDWKPFNDSNGVSGHAFIGSVPFITIAYMNKDNAVIKYSAYLASTLAALSRINDNQHYLSQAILGWYLGWESVDAVYDVEANKKKSLVKIHPVVGPDSYGLMLSMKW